MFLLLCNVFFARSLKFIMLSPKRTFLYLSRVFQRMRFEKQELFKEIGKEGQRKLSEAYVTILGCGALGALAAELLVRAGVKNITLIDRDFVELSNLQRQSLYTERDVGSLKALVLAAHLKEINSLIKVKSFPVDLDVENVMLVKADIVLDCTDNMETRFLLNDFCKREKIPWVFAAVFGSSGFVFPVTKEGPCFACLFSEPSIPLGSCDTEGILNTAVALVVSLQVTETMKIIVGKQFSKDLLSCNVWGNSLEKIKVKKRVACLTCKGVFEYISRKKENSLVKMCGMNLFQMRGKVSDLVLLEKRLVRLGKVRRGEHCLFFKELVIFKEGRVLIRAKSEAIAKSLYMRYLG